MTTELFKLYIIIQVYICVTNTILQSFYVNSFTDNAEIKKTVNTHGETKIYL